MRPLRFVIGAVVIYVLSAATQGIIGNRADAWLPELVAYARELLGSNNYAVAIVALCFVIASVLAIRYRAALRTSSSLNEIDDRLARSIAVLYGTSEARVRAEMALRISRSLCESVLKSPPFDSCGIAIYYPDEAQRRLKTWLRAGTPNESASLSFFIGDVNSFYIGDFGNREQPGDRRGVAGTAFMSSETQVVRFSADGRAENCNFYFPTPEGKGTYRSMICMAVSSGNPHRGNLGVLCLYSSNYRTFGADAVAFLIAITRRLSVVMEPISPIR